MRSPALFYLSPIQRPHLLAKTQSQTRAFGRAAVAEKAPWRSGVWLIRGSHHPPARSQASRAVLPTHIASSPLSSGARRGAFKATNGSSRRLQAPPLDRTFCPAPGARTPARAATGARLGEPVALSSGEEVVDMRGARPRSPLPSLVGRTGAVVLVDTLSFPLGVAGWARPGRLAHAPRPRRRRDGSRLGVRFRRDGCASPGHPAFGSL